MRRLSPQPKLTAGVWACCWSSSVRQELEHERLCRAHQSFMNGLDVQHERKLNSDLKKDHQELQRQKRQVELELERTKKDKTKQV